MWHSFQGVTLTLLLDASLERIFSFFLLLSPILRELIQHSNFRVPHARPRCRETPRVQRATHACAKPLGTCADAVPAIANRLFAALPGAGVARFPVAASIRCKGGPVAPAVALVGA